MAPRLALHVGHEGTRLLSESSPPASCSSRWSAWNVLSQGLAHQWQSGCPSRSAALLALYCAVVFLLPAMCVLVGGLLGMLLAPSQARLLSVATASLVVCASPHFQYVTVAGGLCRTVSHSRLCSSYSAQWLTATALQVKSSQVVVRTALPSFPSVMPTQCNSVCGRGRM